MEYEIIGAFVAMTLILAAWSAFLSLRTAQLFSQIGDQLFEALEPLNEVSQMAIDSDFDTGAQIRNMIMAKLLDMFEPGKIFNAPRNDQGQFSEQPLITTDDAP